jgi:hypothetical protein
MNRWLLPRFREILTTVDHVPNCRSLRILHIDLFFPASRSAVCNSAISYDHKMADWRSFRGLRLRHHCCYLCLPFHIHHERRTVIRRECRSFQSVFQFTHNCSRRLESKIPLRNIRDLFCIDTADRQVRNTAMKTDILITLCVWCNVVN